MNLKKFPKLENYRYYIYLFLTGFVLILLANTPLLRGVTGGLQTFTVPFQAVFYNSFKGVGNTFSTLLQIGNLRHENSTLKIENALLKSENIRIVSLEKENESLRKQLDVSEPKLAISLSAHPVGKGVFGSKSVLEIDKGASDKVQKGDLVIVENMLLGKVIDVSPHLSSVELLNDPETKIPAMTTRSAEGLLIGQFGSEIELSEVVQEDELKEGDLVYTSGKDNYPQGLVLGKIKTVNKVDKELFQKAIVEPLVKVEDLKLVYLIRVN